MTNRIRHLYWVEDRCQKTVFFVACLITLSFLASCVGTIEDTKLKKTETATTTIPSIPFAGLSSVQAVSHDKVEVYFFPAKGKPEDLTYEIYVNGSESPIFIAGSSLQVNPSGKLMYTVTGLQVNTTYSFAVSVRNNATKAKSDEGDTLSATTFQNITADFNGVASLRLPAGLAGKTSVVVEWVPAIATGSPGSPGPASPVAYEIIYISDTGGAANLNNTSHPDRRVNQVPQVLNMTSPLSTERTRTITGLATGTKYFFEVRAIHKGYILYGGLSGDPDYKREENHKFLAITTNLATGMFDFKTEKVKAVSPDGEAALNNIDITWEPATGDFVKYRLYYKEIGVEKVPPGDPDEDPATKIPSAEVDYFQDADGQINRLNGIPGSYTDISADATYYRMASLSSYRHFQIKVAACGNDFCDEANRQVSLLVKATTFPTIAPFDGIDHIDHPRSEDTTRRIHVVFNPPVVASGYLNDIGLYCYSSPTDPSPKKLVYAKSSVGVGHDGLGQGRNYIEIDSTSFGGFPDTADCAAGCAVAIGIPGAADYEVFSYTSKDGGLSRLVSTDDTLDFDHGVGAEVSFSIKDVGSNCHGIYRNTSTPTSQLAYETFEEIDVEGIEPKNPTTNPDGKEYCFSVVPRIDGINNRYSMGPPNDNFPDVEKISEAVVRCITPVIKTPTLAEFTGKSATCTVSGRTIPVNWDTPTGGMYNNFQVFWKRNNTGTPFQFTEAIFQSMPAPGGPIYWTKDQINKNDTLYTVDPVTLGKPPLIPGERYFTGVLAYLQVGVESPYYSESNLNTNDCLIDLPTAVFQEWTEVVAVGPKVDGLTPPDPVTGKRKMILETLDESSVPVEVVLVTGSGSGAGVDIDTDANTGFYLSRGATPFNGVYGVKDGDTNNPKFQYSNSGIIRLAWKDMLVYSPNLYMKDMVSSYESPDVPSNPDYPFPYPAQKKDRGIGYKVYRSDNNRVTWTELTHKDFATQTTTNAGLLRSEIRKTRVRNNALTDSNDVVIFTDYSVQYAENEGEVERGRVYWYKVIPIFNNIPLSLTNSANLIKVTLPPPNMALVHRMMANRTICRELGLAIDTEQGQHYACKYSGAGARGLEQPWPVYDAAPGTPSPYYDLGGDLLVDRFELGCNWTRGDPSPTDTSKSDFDADENEDGLDDFKGRTSPYMGLSDGAPFQGCAQFDMWGEPMQGHAGSGSSNTDATYGRVHQGDCFGVGGINLAGSQCADYTRTQVYSYTFPGAMGGPINGPGENCQEDADDSSMYGVPGVPDYPNWWGEDRYTPPGGPSNDGYPFQNYVAQSEPAAVFYMRGRAGGYTIKYPSSAGPGSFITDSGGGGSGVVAGQCFINLPFKNTATSTASPNRQDGDWTARWWGIHKLFRNNLVTPTGSVTIYDKTLDWVLAHTGFYASAVNRPDVWPLTKRFNTATTPIGKIISSNNAKLPPLGNLGQKDTYDLCQIYQVEVGSLDSAGGSGSGVFYQSEAPAGKRIMTKKEFNVAAAWPDIDSSGTGSGESGFVDNNTYDETMVTDIEKGAYNHVANRLSGGSRVQGDYAGCNTQGGLGVTFGQFIGWDDQFRPTFPNPGTENNPYLWAGSSPNDFGGTNTNSSRCISKFGVQDLAGNIMETVAEQIFCDFSGEVMYLSLASNVTQDPLDNRWKAQESNSIQMYVSAGSGPAITGGPLPATVTYTGGSRSISPWGDTVAYRTDGPAPLRAWVSSQMNTGQCSTAQIGGRREQVDVSGNYPKIMTYRTGKSMMSIFDSSTWSGLNDNVIEWYGGIGSGTGTGWGAHRTFAQELVNDARIGDGFFLDWGQENFGPPLADSDAMRIKAPLGTYSKALFFNPATGLPSACLKPNSYDPCEESPDNVLWTTNAHEAVYGGGGVNLIFDDADPGVFPTNNGDVHNDGLRDLNSGSWYSAYNPYGGPFDYISSVSAGATSSIEDDQWTVDHSDNLFAGETVSTSWAWWVVSRSDPMYMNVGGDATTLDAGRYYAYLRGDNPWNQEDYYTRGGRCVIKVNTAD